MNTSANKDWQKVKDIFADALRESPDRRAQFVGEACGPDADLLNEVNSLLASHQSTETFLEVPAVIQVAKNLMPDENRLASGQILGHYEIRELIGSGGMGEVYLARDKRLNRNVAIKVLRENFRPDHHANGRLLREARAAALLEHPNICQIYEIAESPDHDFIVMQYVVGTSLADLMAKEQLSVPAALDLATQIVDGLAEAHAQGIIHRDIKPGNVIVNKKGQAKILDFGLAKFIEAESGAETSHQLNSSGAVMGTVPFMSPEQLRGKFVDERSDLFSFGSLLYEMVGGKPAFNRENNAETIAAILNDEPDWSVIPTALRPLLEKCLAKEKSQRYHSASEVLKELLDVRENGEFDDASRAFTSPTEQAVTTDGGRLSRSQSNVFESSGNLYRRKPDGSAETRTGGVMPARQNLWMPVAAGLLVLAIGGSALFVWQRNKGAVDSPSSFDSMLPVRLIQWRSGASSNDTDYRVSHDGKLVAYSSSRDGGDEVIYVKQTGDGEEIRVTKDEWRSISPIWSPDDQRIAYVSVRDDEPGIYLVPSLGGSSSLLLATERANLSLRHWSKNGESIYYEQLGNLFRVDLAKRSAVRITGLPDSPGGNDRYFALSPDEKEIVYCDTRDGRRDIWTVPATGGQPTRVTDDDAEEHRPLWHPDGQRILYNALRNDFYQINLAYRDRRPPVQVTRGEGNYELIDLSPDGSRIYYTTWEKRSDVSGVNTETTEESEVAAGVEVEMWPKASPDGRSVVYQANASPNPTANLQASVLMVRTNDGRNAKVAGEAYDPRWLPDSRHVAFLRWNDADSKNQLWIVDTVTGHERQVTTDSVTPPSIGLMPISRADIAEYDFSPDGGRFVYLDFEKPRNVRLGSLDGGPSTKLTDTTPTDVRYFSPLFSPDGNQVACVSLRRPIENPKKPEWNVTFMEDGKVRIVSLPGSARMIGWADSGNEVIVARSPGAMETGPRAVEILRISPDLGSRSITVLQQVHSDSLTLSADRKLLAFTARRNDKDDIWAIPTAGGEARKLTNNGNTRIFYANLAWSPDGKTIFFDKQEQINTISMFENFR